MRKMHDVSIGQRPSRMMLQHVVDSGSVFANSKVLGIKLMLHVFTSYYWMGSARLYIVRLLI
jgi:hypothetical protein